MKKHFLCIVIIQICLATPALAREITVPEKIDGQQVRYAVWKRSHASGGVSELRVNIPFRFNKNKPYKINIRYPYQNSRTCFLNKKKEVIGCE